MPQPVYDALDYLGQFQRLLPRGRVWHRGLGTVQDSDLAVLMPTWVRLHLRLNALIDQIFPCSTTELLPEWEDTLGLPDPCTGPLTTLQERTTAVCGKFTARGGQSKNYFIGVAAALGYHIRIDEFQPFRAGHNHAGDGDYGEEWSHVWRVDAPETTIFYFRAGASTAGDPLREWGSKVLECTLNRIKPAHTVLQFAYVPSGNSAWDGNASLWDLGFTAWDVDET